ncbi:MAG: hypothetical protein KGD65_02190 [Candidatus Lokiarchaeota archaeon]|nr:hypothetical protein [Candidatus Lokiarchaeota archaeon]
MEKVIQDIWIISEAGAVLYHRVFDKKVDEQLFGALMSALNMFAEQISTGGLSSFELQDKKYILMKQDGISFIVNSSTKTKEKKVKDQMRSIASKFINLYPKEFFNDWDNDISIFAGFEEHIKDSLQETIDKFEKAFW